MPRRIVRSGTGRTVLLSACLAAGALALTEPNVAVLGHQAMTSHLVVLVALAGAFFLAEQSLITFEFRRQSHSMTFAGVPLALGVLLLPITMLVLARVVGSLAAMIVQRTSAEKVGYNISAFAFEAALTSTLCRSITGFGPAPVLTIIACIAAVDQLMTALVLVVIRFHGITMTKRDVVQVVSQSLVLSVAATTFAVVLGILLLMHGVTGGALAVALIAVAVLGYRMYAATLRRHHAMTTVHDFVTGSPVATSLADVTASSLRRIRNIVRASKAEVAVVNDDDGAGSATWTVYTVDEDDRLSVRTEPHAPSDWVRMRAFHSGIATLARRGQDAGIDAWLDTAGGHGGSLDDAIVVPIHNGGARFGTLTVSGRLTDIVVFTDDDVQVLQTLSGHLAASMQNARLLETLSYDATHDALTTLVNRSQLMAEISALGDGPAALMVFDVDHFKDVNEVLGHEVADELLVVLASRLRVLSATGRTVARVGGDQFAVLLCDDDARGDLIASARSFGHALAQPLRLHGATVSVTVSVGIAGPAASSTSDLLRCAETAMDIAKTRSDRVAVYSAAMDVGRAERIALAADLRLALEHAPEQFAVHFQPKVDLRSRQVIGAEALVRWNHPSRGIVGPDQFIPIAEATGLIARLTGLVLDEALAECARWPVDAELDVSVNISARLLTDGDVVTMVGDALRTSGLRPDRVILEITESVIMNDPDVGVAVLNELAGLGVRISLDDFGTGYSSLSYLRRLPATELKIDRSFVADVATDPGRSAALLRNIIALGRDLGMHLVAEGIESDAQAMTVEALGCALGQGYYFARPMPADQFRLWQRHHCRTPLRLLPPA